MCQYDGGEVYGFLKERKGGGGAGAGGKVGGEEEEDWVGEGGRGGDVFYNIHTALGICREYNLTDATAYLLELAGDVDDALELMLRKLEVREEERSEGKSGATASAIF